MSSGHRDESRDELGACIHESACMCQLYPPPPPTHTHAHTHICECSFSPTDHTESSDGPAKSYLTLDNVERNQFSVTSGNLALYEVSAPGSLLAHSSPA